MMARSVAAILAATIAVLPAATVACEDAPSVYAVRVNGVAVSDGDVFLKDHAGELYVSQEAVAKWRVRENVISHGAETKEYSGIKFVALAAIPGAVAKIDEEHQQIEVTLPAADFEQTVLSTQGGMKMPAPVGGSGAYANYSLNYLNENGVHAETGQLQGGFSTDAGFFKSSLLYQLAQNVHSLAVLNTAWEHDDPQHRTHFIAGDSMGSADFFARTPLFTGLQFSTDFATDPGFQTFPLPQLNGSTGVPSTVDVYIDNLATVHRQVTPGSFVVSNVPMIDGEDNVSLILTDASGQQHVVRTKYYFARDLLKKHLSQHAVSMGFQQEGYGLSSFKFGPALVSASERYGFTDDFTGGLQVEHAGAVSDMNVSADTVVGSLGKLSANVAGSTASGSGGLGAKIGFDHIARRFTFGALMQANSAHFTTVSSIATGISNLLSSGSGGTLAQIHGSFRLNPQFSVSSAFTDSNVAGSSNKYITLGFTRYTRATQLNVNTYRQIGNGGFGMTVYVMRRLSNGDQVTVQSGTPTLGQNGITIDRPMRDDGFGSYTDARGGVDGTSELYVYHRNANGTWDFDVQHQPGLFGMNAAVNGGLIFKDGRAFVTDSVNGAYGVAKFPGYSNVPVYLNERYVGATNSRGEVALPTLAPFIPNTVRLDLSKQPLSVDATEETKVVVPYRSGAVDVAFVPVDGGGVMVTVVQNDGKPLPRGAILRVGNKEFPMGYAGKAYLGPIHPGPTHVEGVAGDATCAFDINVPQAIDSIPDVGTVVCK